MPPVQRPLMALGLRLLAAMVLSALVAVVKLTVESGVRFPEVLFWRQVPTVFLIGGWLAMRGQLDRLKTRRLPIHARRALIGMIGMFFTFGAPLLLPLTEATTLGFTTPIFAVILSVLLLREQVGPVRWLAVALGFAGVVIITQPGHSHIPPLGAAVGLGAGFMVALISIQVRDLGRTEESISIVFWFAALSAPVLALGLPFFASTHTPYQWGLLLLGGVLGCLGQILLTAALRYGQVASVIVMDYSSLVWATLLGWTFWDQLPTPSTWLGAPLIVAAGAVIAWREHLHAKTVSPATVGAGE
ncbi:DMT family transporter [Novosphingobium sp. B 225]|uniref:DMT family transporter n=1 Tax=Novosphingobium sp. B 225 TaxID=1961849 RepID=UPI000B4A9DA5|nr:DMT family transporter [Novosphingobium sp. B 225]